MLLIQNAMIHDAVRETPFLGAVLIRGGKIEYVHSGQVIDPQALINSRVSDFSCSPTSDTSPKNVDSLEILDAEGLELWPGFVDAHSHLGLFGSGIGYEGSDGNELNDVLTPHLRAVDGFNPFDPAVEKALRGGVTTAAVGPGSANVIGGTFMAVRTFGKRVDSMVLKETVAMKCAFGENPKRVYREKTISSRMTTSAIFRDALFRARDYLKRLEAAEGDTSKAPPFDIRLHSLLPVLRREIPLKAHAHQTNDLFNALRIAREFDLKITLEHVTEGHLIADELAKENVPLAVGPTLGHPTKFELQHKCFETARILTEAGCSVSIITDAPVIPQEMLPFCAGLAIRAGMTPFDALKAITINPARHIGLEDRLGSIEPGKDANLVLSKGSVFELGTKILKVFLEGKIAAENSD